MGKLKPSKKWKRSLSRRRNLPAALTGLVAFSFTLVAFGAVVYAAALPALVQPVLEERGIEERGLGGLAMLAQRAFSAGSGASSSDGADAGAEGSSAARGVSLPSLSLSAGSMPDLPSTLPDMPGGPSSDDAEVTPPNEQPPVEPAPNPGEGGGSEGGGAPGPLPGEETEEDRKLYAALQPYLVRLPDYVERANACVGSFSADSAKAPLSVRRERCQEADTLCKELESEYAALMRLISGGSSKYSELLGHCIGAYRSLGQYIGCYSDAWALNVSFEDPAQHVDAWMRPFESAMVDGRNKYLVEFETFYEGLRQWQA